MKHAAWSLFAIPAFLAALCGGQAMAEPTIQGVAEPPIPGVAEPPILGETESLFPPLLEEEAPKKEDSSLAPSLLKATPGPTSEKSVQKNGEEIIQQADQPVFGESFRPEGADCGTPEIGPCCAVCGEGNSCPPDWYTRQEVRILTRSKARKTTITREFSFTDDPENAFDAAPRWQLIANDNAATAQEDSLWTWNSFRTLSTVMTTKDLGFDVSAGYGTTIGKYLGRDTDNRDQFVEFTYWGLNNWEDSKTTTGGLQPAYLTPVGGATVEGILNRFTEALFGVDTIRWESPPISDFGGSLTSPFPRTTDLNSPTQTERRLSESFNQVLEHTITYSSNIDDFELNARIRPRTRADRLVLHSNGRWRRECRPGPYLSYLFGLRLMSIDEGFRFRSHGVNEILVYERDANGNLVVRDGGGVVIPNPPPTTTGIYTITGQVFDEVTGNYDVRTNNDLFGLQFGGDYIFRRCKWRYGVRYKFGPFINFSDQTSRITTAPNAFFGSTDITRVAKKEGASLLFEFGFTGSYKIRPNMAFRASYDFMWVTGLALAPEQLTFSSEDVVTPVANSTDPITFSGPGRLNDNGHLYYHGLSLGFECLW